MTNGAACPANATSLAACPADALEAAWIAGRDNLVRYLTRLLRCRQGAEDLVQDVYLAIPNVSPIVPILNPDAFLFRIASNLAANRTKQEGRRRVLRDANAAILGTAVDELTPERQLLGVEELALLDAAIARLPDRTRQILAWRRLDGLTNRAIAARLGISDTAVEKHLRTAMAALARVLDDGVPPSPLPGLSASTQGQAQDDRPCRDCVAFLSPDNF